MDAITAFLILLYLASLVSIVLDGRASILAFGFTDLDFLVISRGRNANILVDDETACTAAGPPQQTAENLMIMMMSLST
jgi:hypothetical protein